MVFHLLDLNIVFEMMSGVVALLVSYYAFRYNRLIDNSTLKFISFGFMLLGLGLLTEASILSLVVFGIGDLLAYRLLRLSATSLYSLFQVSAYFVFAIGYIRSVYSNTRTENIVASNNVSPVIILPLAVSIGIQRFNEMLALSVEVIVISSILSLIFLSAVVFLGAIVYLDNRNKLTLLVLLSFSLILVAQAVDLSAVVSVSVVLESVSYAIQFAGFVSLLVFILWRSKIGSTRKAP